MNREAVCGVFVFAAGCEPAEVGDFKQVGEDFFVTVDKEHLADGRPLLYLESAYKIARAQAVVSHRRQMEGHIDLDRIHTELEALAVWSDRIADMATKSRTIQSAAGLV